MFIIWGSSFYGKVDEIPSLGHVATRFGHLYYIPLIPMESYFVTHQSSEGVQGAKIGMSGKSILIAWFRTAAVLLAIFGAIAFLLSFTGPNPTLMSKVIAGSAFSGGIFLYYLSTRFSSASYERAMELSKHVGFDERINVFLDLNFGKINEMEAERRMDALHSNLADLNNLDDEIHASGLDHEYHKT